jgi:hypothetical protein
MACGVATRKEDDDGEGAMQRNKPKVVKQPVDEAPVSTQDQGNF